MKKCIFSLICVLFFEHLNGQATKVVYIEQSSANAKEGVIYYKNRVGLDTLGYMVGYSMTTIADYKFSSDSSVCTILFRDNNIGYSIGRFYKRDNWMPKHISHVVDEPGWRMKKDTFITFSSTPFLLNYNRIHIIDRAIYSTRRTREKIKMEEEVYYLKFDEDDRLIKSTTQ